MSHSCYMKYVPELVLSTCLWLFHGRCVAESTRVGALGLINCCKCLVLESPKVDSNTVSCLGWAYSCLIGKLGLVLGCWLTPSRCASSVRNALHTCWLIIES